MSPHDDANRALIAILRAELPAAPTPAPRPAPVPQDAPPTPAQSSGRITFLPCRSLPADPQTSSERTLYHAQRKSGEMGTMTREGGTWQWRLLRGDTPDAYGSGGWNDLKTWLSK